MITFEAPAIRADFRTGLYTKAELARKYNCHPETITNILNRPEDKDVYVRTTHLDNLLIMPYLDYIRGLLKKGNVQATVIYQKLIEMGAIISLSTVSRAVKRVKHELDLSAIRYETAPGQQAQADWTDFRGYTATVDGYEENTIKVQRDGSVYFRGRVYRVDESLAAPDNYMILKTHCLPR